MAGQEHHRIRTTGSTALNAISAVRSADVEKEPFAHWVISDVIPPRVYDAITKLPIDPPDVSDTKGKRSTYNDARVFINPQLRKKYHVMDTVANTFADPRVVRAIEKKLGVSLAGSYLRIEYCQDKHSFWLEPHKDIPEKLMTMQVYLTNHEELGTSLYDKDHKFHHNIPATKGNGLIFTPKTENSWHGFEKRPIDGIRKSLIINYVTPQFRAKHEFAFPDRPIVSSLTAEAPGEGHAR